MDVTYVLAPFTAWFVAGSLRLAINFVRSSRLTWDQVRLGGLPSNHTAVVSSTAILIGSLEGIHTTLLPSRYANHYRYAACPQFAP